AYVALAGAPPSAVRAGAMGSAYLLALAAGRLTAPLNALGLAALVLLAWDPAALWDRSFQLSFTAMLGVLVIGLPLWRRAQGRLPSVRPAEPGIRALGVRLGRAVAGGVLVSAGAVIGSLPLVALNFGQVPLLGIPATLIALPMLPLLLVAGVVTALVSSVAPLLADATGLVVAAAGGLIVLDAAVVSRVPWGVVQVGFVTAGWAWASYAAMFAVLAVLNRGRWTEAARGLAAALWRGPSRRVEAWAVVAALAVLAGTLWLGVASRPDGLLRVSFLDVGQGDATLIMTPGGASVLIDGGADPRVTIPLLDAALGPGRRRIDVAFLTHPHRDHMGGLLELARRGRIERLIVPPVVAGEDDAWRRELDALDVSVHEGGAGMTVTFTDGVTVEVLNPPSPPLVGTASDLDNNGLVLRVRIKDAALLFTGDLYEDGERLLVDRGAELTAGVLKLGHHGSDRASGTALLRAVAPSIAVVSAGAENPLGHVSPRVLDRLGAPVADGRTFDVAPRHHRADHRRLHVVGGHRTRLTPPDVVADNRPWPRSWHAWPGGLPGPRPQGARSGRSSKLRLECHGLPSRVPEWRIRPSRAGQGRHHDPCPPLRHGGLRGAAGQLERRGRQDVHLQARRALRAHADGLQDALDRPPVQRRGALPDHRRGRRAQR
ncbi:MAG: ComEC/Rec2 family competence protein, partial [Chloroflexi bacterium]|nr:ComEC/Rec2 family competence protein [Chloroflexota bacterium]